MPRGDWRSMRPIECRGAGRQRPIANETIMAQASHDIGKATALEAVQKECAATPLFERVLSLTGAAGESRLWRGRYLARRSEGKPGRRRFLDRWWGLQILRRPSNWLNPSNVCSLAAVIHRGRPGDARTGATGIQD